MQKENIDIIAPQSIRTSIAAFFSNIKDKKPVITTIHNVGSWFYLLVSGLILNVTSTFVVFESEYERRRLIKVGLNWHKTVVIYSGVDLEKFAPRPKDKSLLREIDCNPNDVIIGTIARLSPEKGQTYLIAAMEKVIKIFPKAKLIVIGDGPLKGTLKNQVHHLGLENSIKFLGEQRDIPRYLSVIDLFVLSSIRESFPLSVREAMAMHKPIVATKVGGCDEVINDGATGVLVSPANTTLLANTIVTLLNDKPRMLKMGDLGRLRSSNLFNQRKWLDTTEDIMLYFSQRTSMCVPKLNLRGLLSNLFYYFTKLLRHEHGIRILMYHRINDTYLGDRLCVKTNEFRKHMEFLKKNNYEVIALDEAISQLSAGNKPKVVLTFDDGFEDNYTNAYQILKEYNLPATIFLTVNRVGTDGFLSWDQIKEMVQNNISFGAHTITHLELTKISLDDATREIFDSKKVIEAKGLNCDLFCYPKGKFNQEIKRLVREAGFKATCSIKPGANFRSEDLFELRRTEISGFDSLFDFVKKLAGAFDWMHSFIQKRQTRQSAISNKPINVLYIIWSLGLGGAEQVVIKLARNLDKKRFNPIICCLNEKGKFASELEKERIQVLALQKRGKFDITIIKKLIDVIRQYRVDIIHTHLWGANFWGRIAAKLVKVPVVIATEHNTDVWKTELYFFFDRWLTRWTDKIIAVSNKVKEFYISKGIGPEKIEVIYNGVDTNGTLASSTQCLMKKEFGIENGEVVLAIIGRLVLQKGHRYFLLAFKELLNEYKVKGLIVGSGPLEKELMELCQNLNLNGNVIFTGLRRDIPSLLKHIDILVMPSLREGLPMVALEAMVAGVPIVATKVGGIPELIIDGQTGILVEPDNYVSLKEGIRRLISDKELWQRIRENARKRAELEFSLENMVRKTQDLYEKLYLACKSQL